MELSVLLISLNLLFDFIEFLVLVKKFNTTAVTARINTNALNLLLIGCNALLDGAALGCVVLMGLNDPSNGQYTHNQNSRKQAKCNFAECVRAVLGLLALNGTRSA